MVVQDCEPVTYNIFANSIIAVIDKVDVRGSVVERLIGEQVHPFGAK